MKRYGAEIENERRFVSYEGFLQIVSRIAAYAHHQQATRRGRTLSGASSGSADEEVRKRSGGDADSDSGSRQGGWPARWVAMKSGCSLI